MAVLPPIPSASVRRTASAKPGLRRNPRMLCLTSRKTPSIDSIIRTAIACLLVAACAARRRDRRQRGGDGWPGGLRAGGIAGGDVVVDESAEALRQLVVRASKRREVLTVDEDRAIRRLTGAWKADADVRGLRFAGTIHDTAHDGERERLHALVTLLPVGHLRTNVVLRSLGEFLEGAAGCASASRASGDAWRKHPQPESLQELAC